LEYRKLGKSGLKVSEIGLGGNNFGGLVGEPESITLIRHALDNGINHIDTADGYSMGGERGGSEQIIGKAIKDIRAEVILATKFGMPMGKGPNKQGASRNHIIEAVEASLKRLNTDYIDLYYLHMPDLTTPIEETLRTLNDLVRSGKVRYIGCCNFSGWQLCDALWTSKAANIEAFAATQSNYNIFERSIEAELTPCCQTYKVGFVAYRPLLEGFLTGKYRRGKQPLNGTRLATPVFKNIAGGVLTEENFDKLENLEAFAMERGRKVGELAIAWLLSHPWVSAVIAAATKPEQISGNVGAAQWRLTAAECLEVEQICRPAPSSEFRMRGIDAYPKQDS
jgi:aryl-alcohol dehydrogenase-like predicted oxidoreductase